MKPKPVFSWEQLDRIAKPMLEEDNLGSGFTVREFALRYKMGYSSANTRLRIMEEKGIVRSKMGRRRDPKGDVRNMRIYWLTGE